MAFVSRVRGSTLAPLFAQAARAGVDRATLCAKVGVDIDLRRDADTQIAYDTVTALWQEAARATHDPAFGIHAATAATTGMFDVLEYAALASRTLGDALRKLCDYQRLVTEVATFTLAGDALELGYRLGANRAAPSRHASEYLLACVVGKARQATRATLPASVELRHAAPRDRAAHADFFACRLRFSSTRDAIVFAPETLAAPLERADPALRAILDRHAAMLLDRLPKSELFGVRVAAWLRDHLTSGDAALTEAARHFRLSERGVQRRLQLEDDSFDAIVARTRAGEARRLLDEALLPIGEIAFRLGFSEVSAFHRAFKRWTGDTPSAYRKRAS